MRQTGAVEPGNIPFAQPQPESLLSTFGSWAMIVIGTSRFACSMTLDGW